VTLGSAFYSFMRWEYIDGESPGHFTVDVTEATEWSEELRHMTAGFIEVATSGALGRPVVVTSERPTPDHVIFRGVPSD
jgi:hypothetical protein